MRFLQIVMSAGGATRPPPDPDHAARVRQSIAAEIAAGTLIAIGALTKRATGAARVTSKGGEIAVEDPPSGEGWMSGGGYAVFEAASKDEAIARARAVL